MIEWFSLTKHRFYGCVWFWTGCMLFALGGCDTNDPKETQGVSDTIERAVETTQSDNVEITSASHTALESISLPSVIKLWRSQDYTLEPVFAPSDATDKTVLWTSDNNSVITLESNGTLTAKKLGEARVTATSTLDNSIQAVVRVIVDREIVQIVSGGYHTVMLDSGGNLWATGNNSSGGLGTGDHNDNNSFVKVLENIKSVAAGENHTVALDVNGNIWVTGRNDVGQLGTDNYQEHTKFTQATSDGSFKAIAAGQRHTIALDKNGYVWVTGINNAGEIGLGDKISVNRFTKLSNLSNITSIFAGYGNSFAVNSSGALWATGNNAAGQLGLGDTDNRLTFAPISAISGTGSVAAGSQRVYAIDQDGNLWAAGYNDSGGLGTGSLYDFESSFGKAITDLIYDNLPNTMDYYYLTDAKSVVASMSYAIALDKNGDLWTAGYDYDMFPSDTTTDDVYAALCKSGNYYYVNVYRMCEGRRSFAKVLGVSDVKSLAAGYMYVVALDNNGSLWASGFNVYGQLGIGDTNLRYGFVRVPLPDLMTECAKGQYLDEKSGICKQKVTRIYFFNGIATNLQETKNEKDILQKLYSDKFKKDYKGEVFQFDIGYNFSFGVISDLTEVFRQKWAEKQGENVDMSEAYSIMKRCVDERWLKTDPTCQDFALMQKELSESVDETELSLESANVALEKFNSSALIVQLGEKLKEGGRSVIIAHSQGNLFGNKTYSALIKEYPDQVGMIGVASPAGWEGGKNYYYVTAHDDVVINLLRLANVLTLKLFVGNVLPSNTDNDVPCGHYARGFFNHSFHDGYLFKGTFNRKNEWWIGTEYEFLMNATCPASVTRIDLPSRDKIDKYFYALFDAMHFTKE